jgi:acyl carrier protein
MLDQIKDVLINAIHVEEVKIKPEAKLREDLDIDSLSAVELALELETSFDIRIEDEELVKLVTVQDVVDIVERKKA